MRIVIVLVSAALLVPAPPAVRADDAAGKKRRADLEERLRAADPTTPAEAARKEANDRLAALLRKAARLELLRLDPAGVGDSPDGRRASFHGYGVVVRAAVDKPAQRAGLVASLTKELHWYEGGKALCFRPRHGVRAVAGDETIDLVLCFECGRAKVFRGGEPAGEVVLIGSKWDAADGLLDAAGRPAKP